MAINGCYSANFYFKIKPNDQFCQEETNLIPIIGQRNWYKVDYNAIIFD